MNQIEHKLRLIEASQQKIPTDPYISEVIEWLTDQLRKSLDDKKIMCSALEAISKDRWCSTVRLHSIPDNLSIADMAKNALNRCRDN